MTSEEQADAEEAFLDPAFAVNEDDVGDYQLGDVPVNGHQYLHRVMKEAETLPDVVVADINTKRFATKQTVYVPEERKYEVAQNFLPTQNWQSQQVEDFENVRSIVDKSRCRVSSTIDVQIPHTSDSDDDWFKFVWESDQKEPLLELMLAFNQRTLDRILQLFVVWLEEEQVGFESRSCLWIYSVLACLEIPLMPTTFAALRTLAQLAIERRARLAQLNENPFEKDIAELNLIICIVGRYFKQTDLADEY